MSFQHANSHNCVPRNVKALSIVSISVAAILMESRGKRKKTQLISVWFLAFVLKMKFVFELGVGEGLFWNTVVE